MMLTAPLFISTNSFGLFMAQCPKSSFEVQY